MGKLRNLFSLLGVLEGTNPVQSREESLLVQKQRKYIDPEEEADA